MSKALVIIAVILNIALLLMSHVAFDEIRWDSDWDWNWQENTTLLLIVLAPVSSIFLCYLAIFENGIEYAKATILRRRLESERKILQERALINELTSPKQENQAATTFIGLWTEASKSPSYNKESWIEIEKQLLQAKIIN